MKSTVDNLDTRLMTSHHVTCHVTTVMCLFIVNKKKRKSKEKEISNQENR